MNRKIIIAGIVFLMLFHQSQLITTKNVFASMKNGDMVTLTSKGQIIDTITYNGITVDALYSNEAYAGNDTTYSCAAFVKKFYSLVYGIGVYNLHSSTSVPLIYDSKGIFTITDNPQVGDIVRDNKRTHWAIVKSVSGDIITVVQQSYRSGSMAWINCTIDRKDTGFSYFSYSNRVADTFDTVTEDTAGEDVAAEDAVTENVITEDVIARDAIAGDTTVGDATVGDATVGDAIEEDNGIIGVPALIENGAYNLVQASTITFMKATDADNNWLVQVAAYEDSDKHMLSIVNHGGNQYSLQFLSHQRFISASDTMQMLTTETVEQKFVFVLREKGLYTISPAEDLSKVITTNSDPTQGGFGDLIIKEYSGSMNDCWYINLRSSTTIPITPQIGISKRTLYTGYKDYSIKVLQLIDNSTVSYTTSNSNIATVNEEGVIRPVSKGVATISIKIYQDYMEHSFQILITVKDPYIKLTASSKEVEVGESITFKAKVYGANSQVTWKVSDQSIAKIDSKSGKLRAKKKGSITVSAITKDGMVANTTIKVK